MSKVFHAQQAKYETDKTVDIVQIMMLHYNNSAANQILCLLKVFLCCCTYINFKQHANDCSLLLTMIYCLAIIEYTTAKPRVFCGAACSGTNGIKLSLQSKPNLIRFVLKFACWLHYLN